MKKFVVIVTCYNDENIINQNLLMLSKQKEFNDFDFIYFDDCSTDNTVSLIEEFYKANKNVKVIKQSKNTGSAIARINAAKQAKSLDYKSILFLDSDDVLDLQILKEIVDSDISGKCIKGCSCINIFDQKIEPFVIDLNGIDEYLKYQPWLITGTILDIDMFLSLNFHEKYDIGEDYHTFCLVNTNKYKVVCGKYPLYYWRLRSGSLTQSKLNIDKLISHNWNAIDTASSMISLNVSNAKYADNSRIIDECIDFLCPWVSQVLEFFDYNEEINSINLDFISSTFKDLFEQLIKKYNVENYDKQKLEIFLSLVEDSNIKNKSIWNETNDDLQLFPVLYARLFEKKNVREKFKAWSKDEINARYNKLCGCK